MKSLYSTVFCLLITFIGLSQKIISSYPKQIENNNIATIIVKCNNVDFTNNNYTFNFSNSWGYDFISINKVEYLCSNTAKLTILSSNSSYFNQFDLTINDINNNTSYTLKNALTIKFTGNPKLTKISKNRAKKGEALTVKFSGLKTHFKSGQASETIVSLTNYQASETLKILANALTVNSETDLDATFEIPFNAPSGLYYPEVNNYIDGQVGLYNEFESLLITNDNPIEIISVVKQNSASKTTNFQSLIVTINTDLFEESASSTVFGIFVNGNFHSASTTIIAPNQFICNFDLPKNAYNGTYPLYLFFNHGDYIEPAKYENGVIINSNPKPSIINLPIKLYAGKNNQIALQGINLDFTQASSSIEIEFNQGSSTTYDIDISNNSASKTIIYVPKNVKSGFYNLKFRPYIYDFNDFSNSEYINGIEVINENPVSIDIENTQPLNVNENVSIQLKTNNLNLNDITNIYLISSEEKNPLYINQSSVNSLTLTGFISPLIKSGLYTIYFETQKDGVFESNNQIKIKGLTPEITNIEPSTVSAGKTYTFTISTDNVVLNTENLKGLYFEFESECKSNAEVLTIGKDSITIRLNINSDIEDGKYSMFLINDNYEIISEKLLTISKTASIQSKSIDQVTIYPNPISSSSFNILINNEKYEGSYKISDLNGKVLWTKQENNLNLDLNPGIYFVSFESNKKLITQKIIIE